MHYKFLAALAVCCSIAGVSLGQVPHIVVGAHNLLPNTANQTVPIFVTGGQAVDGLNFSVQIGDGGAVVGGSDSALTSPIITGVDVLTGAIFGPNNTGINDGQSPLLWSLSTTTNSGNIAANGLLGTITVSTVGLGAGITKPLILDPSPHAPNTNFGLVGAQITDGTLTIVPEPSSLVLAAIGLAAVGWRGLRRRQVAA